jgi:hypothetical protein
MYIDQNIGLCTQYNAKKGQSETTIRNEINSNVLTVKHVFRKKKVVEALIKMY